MQVIASGTEEIEALKAQVSALEKQLKEKHDEDSMNMETMAVDKDQIKQLKERVVVLDRELEGAALVSEHELVCWKIHVKIMQYSKQVCGEQHLKCCTPLPKCQNEMLTGDGIFPHNRR